MGLSFDGTISVGTLIQIIVVVGGWVWTASTLSSRLSTVEKNQDFHTSKLNDLTNIANMQARIDERMIGFRRELDDIKRGKGFIQREVEGEYTSSGKIG